MVLHSSEQTFQHGASHNTSDAVASGNSMHFTTFQVPQSHRTHNTKCHPKRHYFVYIKGRKKYTDKRQKPYAAQVNAFHQRRTSQKVTETIGLLQTCEKCVSSRLKINWFYICTSNFFTFAFSMLFFQR